MAYENFTTFTEEDIGADRLQVTSNTHIDCNEYKGKEYILLHKDYGEWHFGNCEIEIESECTQITGGGTGGNPKRSCVAFLGLANTKNIYSVTSTEFRYGGVWCDFFNPTSNNADLDIRLKDTQLGNEDTFAAAAVGTHYYFNFTKTGSDCTLYIYDDAPRTNLIDTLTIETTELEFKMIHTGSSYWSEHTPFSSMWVTIDNLEIISASAETPPLNLPSVRTQRYDKFIENDPANEIYMHNIYWYEADLMASYNNSYLYKNYGSGHFENFRHSVQGSCTDVTLDVGFYGSGVAVWALSNSPAYVWANYDAAYEYSYVGFFPTDAATLNIRLLFCDNPEYNADTYADTLWGYNYYFEIERDDTTLTCKIYKEATMLTLLDTLSVSCTTVSFQYLYGLSRLRNAAGGTHLFNCHSMNLKILGLIPPNNPGNSGPTDGASNAEFPTGELSVDIPEGNGDCTVYFYDDEDNLIGQAEGEGGDTVTVPWDGLECEEEYGWYVVIDDGDSEVTSTIWYFTCGDCNVFTISSESHPTIHLHPPRFGDGEQYQLNKEINRFGFWSEAWATHD